MSTPFFDYALPVTASSGASQPESDKDKDKDDKQKGDKPQPVQTQMKGEKPGDDLGYDPKIIPTEKI